MRCLLLAGLVCAVVCSPVERQADDNTASQDYVLLQDVFTDTGYNTGNYLDRVSGKPLMCQPDIALVVDTSTSIGSAVMNSRVLPFLGQVVDQLARMPRGPDDDSFGTQLYLTMFHHDVSVVSLDSVGQTNTNSIKTSMARLLRDPDQMRGGSCMACGLQAAREALVNGTRGNLSPKFIIIVSDGMDNDFKNRTDLTPTEVAAFNRRQEDITHFAVGVIGQANKVDEEQMRLIADTPDQLFYFNLQTASDISKEADNILDRIVGAACMVTEDLLKNKPSN